MTASEFAFLALGLVLGIATGAAIVEVLRARPAAPRQVRITVTTDSVPRRAVTLATSPYVDATSTARGGPAERPAAGSQPAAAGTEPAGAGTQPALAGPASLPSTSGHEWDVRDPASVAAPSAIPSPEPIARERPERYPFTLQPSVRGRERIGIPVRPDSPPKSIVLDAVEAAEAHAAAVLSRAGGAEADEADGRRGTGSALAPLGATVGTASPAVAVAEPAAASATATATATAKATAVAVAERAGDDPERPAVTASAAATGTTDGASAGVSAAPCADLRRVADERCALAATAADRATAAAAALHDLQRIYDEHTDRADRAAAAGDPVRVRAAKEAAQQAFRRARDVARSRAELEEAARAWLAEINAINNATRGSSETAARERTAAAELVPRLERLAVEADAARIAAESAEEACVAAREAAADCEEASARAAAPPVTPPPLPSLQPSSRRQWDDADEADEVAAAVATGRPLVMALLRGDRQALARAASAIGGDDAEERRRWTLELGRLLEAIVERAIEAASLDFPTEHPFWGGFTLAEDREIAAALASLGYRFDGMGGWLDGRVPSQRDLSLAVGYAGLDPMRIRRWPNEAETSELFRDVRVAADEYLAGAAGGFTLGELVSLLGRRADGLTETWNAWGRVRPILLEPAG